MSNNILRWAAVFCIGILIGAIGVLWFQAIEKETLREEEETASIKWRQNHFVLSEENLYNELVAQGVEFPKLVQAQAILETDSFRSFACLKNNNLFGLRKSDGTYMSFTHWTLSVDAYRKCMRKYRHPPNISSGYMTSSKHQRKLIENNKNNRND